MRPWTLQTFGLYVSCLWPLCFMLAASMFHACGLYLRHMATIRGGLRSGRKEAIRGACCALWLWEAGLQTPGLWGGLETSGLGLCFWLVLFGRSFRGSFFGFVLLVILSWFVLLVVLFVVRSFGGSYVFFVRCFKSLRGVCGKVRGFLMQR